MKQDFHDPFAGAVLITVLAVFASILASATAQRIGIDIPFLERIRMPSTGLIRGAMGIVIVVVVALGVVTLASGKNEDRVLIIILGSIFVFLGGTGLITGKIAQRFNAGPPLEGPAAMIGSVALLAFGFRLIYVGFKRRSDADRQQDGS